MSESTNTPAPSDQPKAPKKVSKPTIPKADANFSTQSNDVEKAWEQNPQITLIWTTQADFKAKVALYTSTLGERKSTGSNRPSLTNDLKSINQKLDAGIDYIKRYLGADFGDNATVQYAKFGIEKENGTYRLPKDRDKRSGALKLVLPAIAAQGYNNKEYGKAYFTPLIASFNTMYDSAKETDGNVSGLVSDKNVLKAEIKKVLKSLIKVIEANYPDTTKAVLRKWGFQKEKA